VAAASSRRLRPRDVPAWCRWPAGSPAELPETELFRLFGGPSRVKHRRFRRLRRNPLVAPLLLWTLVRRRVRWRELVRIRIISTRQIIQSEMDGSRELPRVLRAAYFAMHRISDAHFSRYGVTADQFVLLACLAENNGITQQVLACRASSDPSTIRAMLVLLEDRDLVARGRHPDDGRARVVTLTPKGRHMVERLRKTSEPIREQMLAGFSAEAARLLIAGLRRVTDNIAAVSMSQPQSAPIAGRRRREKQKLTS
jgi:DNA-binding MarR family transcriptional regulator